MRRDRLVLAGLLLGAALTYAILQLLGPSAAQQARLRSASDVASSAPTAVVSTPETPVESAPPAATPTLLPETEPAAPQTPPQSVAAAPAAAPATSASPTADLPTPIPTSRSGTLPAASPAGVAGAAPVIARAPSFFTPSKVVVSIGCPIPAKLCPLLRPVYDSTGLFLGFGVQVPQGTPVLAAVGGAGSTPTYGPLAGVEVTSLTIPSPDQDFGVNYTVTGHLTPAAILRRGDQLGSVGAGRIDLGPRVVAPMNVLLAVSRRSTGQPLPADQVSITSV